MTFALILDHFEVYLDMLSPNQDLKITSGVVPVYFISYERLSTT